MKQGFTFVAVATVMLLVGANAAMLEKTIVFYGWDMGYDAATIKRKGSVAITIE